MPVSVLVPAPGLHIVVIVAPLAVVNRRRVAGVRVGHLVLHLVAAVLVALLAALGPLGAAAAAVPDQKVRVLGDLVKGSLGVQLL